MAIVSLIKYYVVRRWFNKSEDKNAS
jgi:hypothetical protein